MNITTTRGLTKKQNKQVHDMTTVLALAAMIGSALLTGILPQTLLSAIVLVATAALFVSGELYLAFPIMIFYYEAFGIFAGMSVYRYFSLLFILYSVVKQGAALLKRRQALTVFIYVVYIMAVVLPDNLRRGIFVIVDLVCILFLINAFLNNEQRLKSFFQIYIYIALAAFVTGIVTNTSRELAAQIGSSFVTMVRNYGTFEDPNYAGLFYTVGIFAMLTLELFKPSVRSALVMLLTCMVATTLSITAIVVNVVLWFVYLFVFRKLKPITFLCILLVIIILLGLYSYGLENPTTPVIGMFSARIQDKLQSLEQGDINSVTSSRINFTQKHLEYFGNQSPIKMLVGMNAASTIKTELGDIDFVAHNEYVDLLLNVGLIGATIFLLTIFGRTVECYRNLRKTGDKYSACVFMIKVIWMLYGLTLTMFGDYRFMMLFFM